MINQLHGKLPLDKVQVNIARGGGQSAGQFCGRVDKILSFVVLVDRLICENFTNYVSGKI